jgi:subfamily B ATP-binding cassette protein MsbA
MTEPTSDYHSGFYSYRRLLLYLQQYWSWFLFGIIGTILLASTDAGLIWFLKPLLNKGFVDKDIHFINYLPFILILAFLLRGIANSSCPKYRNGYSSACFSAVITFAS